MSATLPKAVAVAAARVAAHKHHGSILTGIDFANDSALAFQSAYTESIKHFLLIGFLALFVGALVFVYMSFQRNQKLSVGYLFLLNSVQMEGLYSSPKQTN
jgi:predicted ABC-type ATPase